MKAYALILVAILSIGVLANSVHAQIWVKTPDSCPKSYLGQSCVPNVVCGLIDTTVQCNSTTIPIPTTYNPAYQSQVNTGLATGYVLNCLADTTCVNKWSCQVNSTCEATDKNWKTNCTSTTQSSCAKECKSGYTNCGTIASGTWAGWPICNVTSVSWCQSPKVYNPCTGVCSDPYVLINATGPISPSQIGNASISGSFSIGKNLTVDGYVGIGTTNPAYKLEVKGDIANTEQAGSYSITRLKTWGLISTGNMYIEPGPGTKLFITPTDWSQNLVVSINGNVGIGTLVPAYKLDVDGAVRGSQLCIGTDCRSSWPSGITSRAQDNYIPRMNGTSVLENSLIYQSDGGNIGIGTTSPIFKLTLDKGATYPDGGIFAEGSFGSGATLGTLDTTNAVLLWYPRKAAFRAGFPAGNAWTDANIGSYSFAAGFGTKATGSVSTAFGTSTWAAGENSIALGQAIVVSGKNSVGIGLDNTMRNVTQPNVMVIMGGNVGIGTLNPAYKLDVSGDINAVGNYKKGGTNLIVHGTITNKCSGTGSSVPSGFSASECIISCNDISKWADSTCTTGPPYVPTNANEWQQYCESGFSASLNSIKFSAKYICTKQ